MQSASAFSESGTIALIIDRNKYFPKYSVVPHIFLKTLNPGVLVIVKLYNKI